jgi:hypothetical protein
LWFSIFIITTYGTEKSKIYVWGEVHGPKANVLRMLNYNLDLQDEIIYLAEGKTLGFEDMRHDIEDNKLCILFSVLERLQYFHHLNNLLENHDNESFDNMILLLESEDTKKSGNWKTIEIKFVQEEEIQDKQKKILHEFLVNVEMFKELLANYNGMKIEMDIDITEYEKLESLKKMINNAREMQFAFHIYQKWNEICMSNKNIHVHIGESHRENVVTILKSKITVRDIINSEFLNLTKD